MSWVDHHVSVKKVEPGYVRGYCLTCGWESRRFPDDGGINTMPLTPLTLTTTGHAEMTTLAVLLIPTAIAWWLLLRVGD